MFKLRHFIRDVRQIARAHRSRQDVPSYNELRESERRYRLIAEKARDIIWLFEYPDQTRYVSPACEELLGWSPADQIARKEGMQMLTPESAEASNRIQQDAIARRLPSVTYEAEHNRIDGTTIWCEVHQGFTYDEAGRPLSIVGVTRDISEKRRLQEQLAQAQKKEAIGTLAGGVAHDFNNFLTVIIASLELLIDEWEKNDPRAQLIRGALDAAERSAALTAQILSFSRHQPLSVESIDVNTLIERARPLLRRAAGEGIGIEFVPEPDLPSARADDNQLHQVLLNLVMNARDAIGETGRITIRTARVVIDSAPPPPTTDAIASESNRRLIPGPYIRVAVDDDGAGMPAEVAEQATRAFFSTKAKGKGTGLGLAMVESIVTGMGGALSISSEVGVGTTVEIYLPQDEEAAAARRPHAPASDTSHAVEVETERHTILIVDDDEAVQHVTARLLEAAGYRTILAGDAEAALECLDDEFNKNGLPDLVLTDLVMPGMSGTELAQRARERYSGLRFVVMSGYAEQETVAHGQTHLPGPLVTKPFHSSELLRCVRSILA